MFLAIALRKLNRHIWNAPKQYTRFPLLRRDNSQLTTIFQRVFERDDQVTETVGPNTIINVLKVLINKADLPIDAANKLKDFKKCYNVNNLSIPVKTELQYLELIIISKLDHKYPMNPFNKYLKYLEFLKTTKQSTKDEKTVLLGLKLAIHTRNQKVVTSFLKKTFIKEEFPNKQQLARSVVNELIKYPIFPERMHKFYKSLFQESNVKFDGRIEIEIIDYYLDKDCSGLLKGFRTIFKDRFTPETDTVEELFKLIYKYPKPHNYIFETKGDLIRFQEDYKKKDKIIFAKILAIIKKNKDDKEYLEFLILKLVNIFVKKHSLTNILRLRRLLTSITSALPSEFHHILAKYFCATGSVSSNFIYLKHLVKEIGFDAISYEDLILLLKNFERNDFKVFSHPNSTLSHFFSGKNSINYIPVFSFSINNFENVENAFKSQFSIDTYELLELYKKLVIMRNYEDADELIKLVKIHNYPMTINWKIFNLRRELHEYIKSHFNYHESEEDLEKNFYAIYKEIRFNSSSEKKNLDDYLLKELKKFFLENENRFDFGSLADFAKLVNTFNLHDYAIELLGPYELIIDKNSHHLNDPADKPFDKNILIGNAIRQKVYLNLLKFHIDSNNYQKIEIILQRMVSNGDVGLSQSFYSQVLKILKKFVINKVKHYDARFNDDTLSDFILSKNHGKGIKEFKEFASSYLAFRKSWLERRINEQRGRRQLRYEVLDLLGRWREYQQKKNVCV